VKIGGSPFRSGASVFSVIVGVVSPVWLTEKDEDEFWGIGGTTSVFFLLLRLTFLPRFWRDSF